MTAVSGSVNWPGRPGTHEVAGYIATEVGNVVAILPERHRAKVAADTEAACAALLATLGQD